MMQGLVKKPLYVPCLWDWLFTIIVSYFILNNWTIHDWCFRAELEDSKEIYDVIIGDLADPIEGGPCYKLYTKSFYEFTVKPKMKQGGIFVTQVCGWEEPVWNCSICKKKVIGEEKNIQNITYFCFILMQAGPAGIFSHTEVFSCIFNTLRQVFKCK